ncbi:unnamed protein product, partial [Gulo gulo]
VETSWAPWELSSSSSLHSAGASPSIKLLQPHTRRLTCLLAPPMDACFRTGWFRW